MLQGVSVWVSSGFFFFFFFSRGFNPRAPCVYSFKLSGLEGCHRLELETRNSLQLFGFQNLHGFC